MGKHLSINLIFHWANFPIVDRLIFILIVSSSLLSCTAISTRDRIKLHEPYSDYVYFLEFDRQGNLVNPTEVIRAAKDIKERGDKKILLLSFGWMNSRDKARETYTEFIKDYQEKLKIPALNGWSIFCVSWDSSTKVFSSIGQDLLIVQNVTAIVGGLLDILLTPLTFWSKASLARKIGHGDLKEAIEYVVEKAYPVKDLRQNLEIHLVAHSFGGIIMSKFADSGMESFKYRTFLRSSVLILPAMISWNIPTSPERIVIIQSKYDHANSFLYPIANLLLNTLAIDSARATLGGDFGRSGPRKESVSVSVAKDIGALPIGFVWSLVITPINYLVAQAHEIASRNVNYIPDTLSQLPGTEVLIDGLDSILPKENNWGKRNKGLFNMGATAESVTRTPSWTNRSDDGFNFGRETSGIIDIKTLLNRTGPFPRKLTYIDASEVIDGISWADVDMGTPIVDYTIGWLDPIGAHTDYHQLEVYQIIHRVLIE